MTASRHCLVVGAGIAGATMARALADKGWQVDVFDQATSPAAGASGVPIGVLSCHVSVDDNPMSKLTREGLLKVRTFAEQHLVKGQDWLDCGVLERRLDGHTKKKIWQPIERDSVWHGWVQTPTDLQLAQAGLSEINAHEQLWQAPGAWIKPAPLIKALLNHPSVHFHGGQCLQAKEMQALGYPAVVLALGAHTSDFLAELSDAPELPLVPVAGQISWGLHDAEQAKLFPPFAVNGYGGFVSHVPTPQGLAWYSGATFHRGQANTVVTALDHASNFEKLEQLLPQAAQALRSKWQTADSLGGWAGVRCTSVNRVPIARALDAVKLPDWYVLTALGSRGLTLAMQCAEQLAEQINNAHC
ncbi:MAG: FAD-dependent 5-carboxymethylaminomethyl-2-thiouridine(34) oxidoreductase MnmC [Burkholderiales bacterium]|nr:FAD-dependent 5-carboxymethylaminomethyl-2-thiouridine(34) oxidoreductase MnmC [Burkholderiales bacterium]